MTSKFIPSTKLGMMNAWRLLPGNTAAERRAIPISVENNHGNAECICTTVNPQGSDCIHGHDLRLQYSFQMFGVLASIEERVDPCYLIGLCVVPGRETRGIFDFDRISFGSHLSD